ncbi:hypothetical protein ACJMK2_013897 [Sinanodonta woodiana]|uniref:Roc domain-containing protein n=1 Tax=Sinanodonta woodiana TaxID=1069815 RepID=A0ABD3V077_SINWO
MDPISIEMYRKALRNGKEKVFNIRIMIVGPYDVGKTTLTKRLLGKEVNICDRQSTEGIDVQTECCKVSLATGEWMTQEQNADQYSRLKWLVMLFNNQVQQKSSEREQMPKVMETHVITAKEDYGQAEHDHLVGDKQDVDEEVMPPLPQPLESPIVVLSPEESSDVARENEKKDTVMEIVQLINANSDKLEITKEEYAKLGIWDFAGQYVFYTTHQTFLSYRAIYLLVIDLSQQITALIEDECFIDTAGLKLCQVQETIDTWMNLIHSCTPSSQPGIPAVILVGTHVDKINEKQMPAKGVKSDTQTPTSDTEEFTLPTTSKQDDNATNAQPRPSTFLRFVRKFPKKRKSKRSEGKTIGSSSTGAHPVSTDSQDNTTRSIKEKVDAEKRYRHEVCEKYFREIRSYLKDKPTVIHLVDEDFAIDNTVVDSNLVALKKKIVEVASQQPYWGEEVPARWILLERELMRLKAAGIKLKHFLSFIHFSFMYSIEVLKDKIVLVPQWMIDAVKSLITAEMFVLRNAPAVARKWDTFNKSGKLYPELIDAIWTKEKYPDLHDNKEHILLLMEHLNIIARPRCFSDDGSEIKVDNYFLAPYLQGNVDVPCHFHDIHVITSQDVLRFWFQEEEPSDVGSPAGAMPSPLTSDTDRFMCIAYLLVDIGSRVLRQLLSHHTVTSTCTLGQYLARNISTINKLTRVFNPSLMDIMFPPNGDDTSLYDYDITLLSAIFQNIVPTLSKQEEDMIQRLREERNKLYAHAKSCQISANDFHTYWNDISSILTTLSQQCGDTDFEAKILQEIQRTKVSAIPAGSYLDILKTWFRMIESVKDELQDVTARVQALESNIKSSASES